MDDEVIDKVRTNYAAVAVAGLSTNDAGVRSVAEAFGYSPDELASVPAEANMGLSCGNPLALARLGEGETVVDLGCGGGLDVLLAAKRLGPTGKAIGIDMTDEMLDLARKNADRQGIRNVEFQKATIDKLPLSDASVDCIISNCVVNLAPDKDAVFREMFRVLRRGGRVAISDIALKKPLPDELARNLLAYVGCISGTSRSSTTNRGLQQSDSRRFRLSTPIKTCGRMRPSKTRAVVAPRLQAYRLAAEAAI